MIIRELLGLTYLSRAKTLSIYKLSEVIVINGNKDLIFIVFKIIMPSFKDFNNK